MSVHLSVGVADTAVCRTDITYDDSKLSFGLGIDRTMPQLDVTCFHIARMRHSISKMQLDFSQLQLDVSPQAD
ncbi:BZ3500_MvSof-1268-A1-R1_Chr12-1g03633 [Microbotryum saponariae]|uniref:BZ3500_MvSof-1268-A1-R1_C069g00349 protein n=1 Tax=Microbotryum saponariae TaxID=289078 RepID=A0A2X0NHY1_9BASI|nr:BZ3500_MvSof-1268-A1-R1_C069g00349 [Microbotryum saponariae]SCZ92978.1 BZ3500_MvSof-1268-A1-R1_C071g00365 [Microbotryum saponariae]SCZ94749.1 BZ3500_MvSof-1268-A1-R1_Chr12-1g03633 [Microbotryum saponariae]SDA05226.1 BZ3501_MvSof-1269-A2-R1_Chr12-1g03210 [Microbotryum saponariae]